MRNVTHHRCRSRRGYRVLKPGGRFLCLEFSAVETPILDALYDAYSMNAIPALGALVAGDAASYRYLVESIRRFPDQKIFMGMIENAGFERVRYRNLTGGIAAIVTQAGRLENHERTDQYGAADAGWSNHRLVRRARAAGRGALAAAA
jgi:demethylmenaquinone methyltransferase/2-methoxy-6-polyprenyl-1,4-benzoquinol methylase